MRVGFVINKTMEKLQEMIPTREAFLKRYPILKKYIYVCHSYGEQISHLNIAIVNIRHELGWKNINEPYAKFVTEDLQKHEDLREIAGMNPALLKLLLNCMVHILWIVTEDALGATTLIDGEKINMDFGLLKMAIYNYEKP